MVLCGSVYISHGDHIFVRRGSCVGGLHGVGTPEAGGGDPMLLCTLRVSFSCYIVIALYVLAKQGWRSAVSTERHMKYRGYPCFSRAQCSVVYR